MIFFVLQLQLEKYSHNLYFLHIFFYIYYIYFSFLLFFSSPHILLWNIYKKILRIKVYTP